MKLLLDQGTPRSAAILLRQAGFDTIHTGEIGMTESEDEEILKCVIQQCPDDLTAGAVVSVNDFQIRLRHLPIA